ncbi:hypothetical protein D8780_14460 [Notoacmeibacter ruber]|uniref:Citrate transporter n=2 Tax=Notoacmeibacter ruber TaxID=2670375 RepID=A0A3L7JH44_9HYPH|nr:hypothetical protein D8780_14460 [Notoacmeibacter ruber]
MALTLYLILSLPKLAPTRIVFVIVAIGLSIIAITTRDDWSAILWRGMVQANFICGFFVALATLRVPAMRSEAINRAGRYIATQPPGRRYLALSSGGHLFALVLNYGSIQLLGSMVERLMGEESDPTIAKIRNRRMLLAIQRGFLASIFWSPLAFGPVITIDLIAGGSWAQLLPFGLLHAAIFTAGGWALDTALKPKVPGGRPVRRQVEGSARDLLPLLLLLLITLGGVGLLELATHLRVAAIVMVFVPLVALAWLLLESRQDSDDAVSVPETIHRFTALELPNYRAEIVLLVMAGFIGATGGAMAPPWIAALGIDLSALPVLALLFGIVIFIPIAGQLGMNPILGVVLFAPLLPSASELGIPPALLILSILTGWVLSGLTSPFTATTMLIGRFGGVSAWRAGVVWNAAFIALSTGLFLLSLTALLFATG